MLQSKNMILRDFKESDIEKRTYWETVETEWQRWDSPWEYEDLTGKEKGERLLDLLKTIHGWLKHPLADSVKRDRFEIEVCDPEPKYIGWVASYYINENFTYTQNKTTRCAVGIDIPDQSARGKGYACQALCIFIDYLLEHGVTEIYTQTWSGNERMVHIAEKLGFEECGRKKNLRVVRGREYDWVTFRLDEEKYQNFRYRCGIL